MNAAVAAAKAVAIEARAKHKAAVEKHDDMAVMMKALVAGVPVPPVHPEVQGAYEELMAAEAAWHGARRAAEAVEAEKLRVWRADWSAWKLGA